jgi:hypothetical protein
MNAISPTGSRGLIRALAAHCRLSTALPPPRLCTAASNGYILTKCFHATSRVPSGHSRWSKIKHDKAKEDGRTTAVRARFAHDIVTLVKCMYFTRLPDAGLVRTKAMLTRSQHSERTKGQIPD